MKGGGRRQPVCPRAIGPYTEQTFHFLSIASPVNLAESANLLIPVLIKSLGYRPSNARLKETIA